MDTQTTSKKTFSSYSRYWMDDNFFNNTSNTKEDNVLKMATIQRAIANYVKLLTGGTPQIDVIYKTGTESYTDGKSVVLSADCVKDKNFDVAVGLALHEASHIKLTDFSVIRNIVENSHKIVGKQIVATENKFKIDHPTAIDFVVRYIKDLNNWIEDRRIDNFVFESAPGYRGYYTSMYEHYFNNEETVKGINSKEFRTETFENYFFHIINFVSSKRNLKALKGLEKIYDLIDISDISRFKNTQETMDCAIKVYDIILSCVEKMSEPKKDDPNKPKQDGEGDGDSTDNKSGKGSGKSKVDPNADIKLGNGDGNPVDTKDLTPAQIEKIKKLLEKIKGFMSGEGNDKEKTTQEKANAVSAINGSDINLECVGYDKSQIGRMGNMTGKVEAIVIKKLTKSFIDTNPFGIFQYTDSCKYKQGIKNIEKGITLGTVLGKKIQIRNEERTTVFTHLRNGKIDKRLISGLGFGVDGVFNQKQVDRFNPMVMYISIDGSGSMSGSKWDNTMIATVAIAKAASMIQNLDVVINIRYTTSMMGENRPVVLIAYDSRKDKFEKIKNMFAYLNVVGCTPEGLCFEAIQKLMTADKTKDQYFLNFSDGQPEFSSNNINYNGNVAIRHTANEVKKFRDKGIKILSFFISNYSSCSLDNFKRMYGKEAVNIDPTEIIALTREINRLFLTKNNG